MSLFTNIPLHRIMCKELHIENVNIKEMQAPNPKLYLQMDGWSIVKGEPPEKVYDK